MYLDISNHGKLENHNTVIGDGVVITQDVYITLTSCKDVPMTSIHATSFTRTPTALELQVVSLEGWHRYEGIHSGLKHKTICRDGGHAACVKCFVEDHFLYTHQTLTSLTNVKQLINVGYNKRHVPCSVLVSPPTVGEARNATAHAKIMNENEK